MKYLLIYIFCFISIIKLTDLGVIDNRISTDYHFSETSETIVPTDEDIERIIREIKLIKSKIELLEAERQHDSFFENQPYKVLKKKNLLITNQF